MCHLIFFPSYINKIMQKIFYLVLTDNWSVRKPLTDNLKVRRSLTDNLSVRRDLIDNLSVRRCLTDNLSVTICPAKSHGNVYWTFKRLI